MCNTVLFSLYFCLYWRIGDLLCVSFRCRHKWVSYTPTCTRSFLESSSTLVITEEGSLCSTVGPYLLFLLLFSHSAHCDPMDYSMPGFRPCPSPSPIAWSNSHPLSQSVIHLTSRPRSPFFCLQSSVFPSIRVFFSELALHIRGPKYWSFSFSISSSNEYLGLMSFRIDWADPFAVQRTLKSLLQHHSSKASIWPSAFFIIQLSHAYKTAEKTYTIVCIC